MRAWRSSVRAVLRHAREKAKAEPVVGALQQDRATVVLNMRSHVSFTWKGLVCTGPSANGSTARNPVDVVTRQDRTRRAKARTAPRKTTRRMTKGSRVKKGQKPKSLRRCP